MTFDEYLAEDMRDPAFRFWWRVRAPEFWVRKHLGGALFRLRDLCHAAALRVLGVRIAELDDDPQDVRI